ncbi:MAG: hypothetical protein COV29_04080 [Candidatus Yanofskybacteria bacterium CG10_big_fil_rev_8_21_14_0_10_36_16]|uniref:Uncharacterized protein n=1 Tax=Candidatus Yanofskybacteria bacterium CG10_big_fil_rev_8_21_14_0_10_36_16 TaxID=1975096 RepID=A0A2J0Q6R7_9BACT|nr:MAG: hypothetical protein COV29_04080 [Candidatus Yanofskybacteria bacterium CG10_big_fil_rev_8_21_14_0_10_36_16]
MAIHLEDNKMDEIIKTHIGNKKAFGFYDIDPSSDFTKNVMIKLHNFKKMQNWMSKLAVIAVSLSPFSIRIIWDYVRGDYFSVSSMPLGNYLYQAYHVLMTSMAAYSMFALGIVAAFLFLNKNKITQNIFTKG